MSNTTSKLRKQVLNRDLHHCIFPFCNEDYLDVHHVHYISQGGTNDPDNLATLCKIHHAYVHDHNFSISYIKQLRALSLGLLEAEKHATKYPKRILRANDADIDAALKLYVRAFPDEYARDSPEDIKKWIIDMGEITEDTSRLLSIRENMPYMPIRKMVTDQISYTDLRTLKTIYQDPAAYNQYIKENILQSEQYVWVDKHRESIDAFIYYEYYYDFKMAIIDYLASENPKHTSRFISKSFVEILKNKHPECQGIVAECEDPSGFNIEDKKKARARLRLFSRKWGINILEGAAYYAPKTNLDTSSKEVSMFLIYIPLRYPNRKIVSQQLFNDILDMLLDYSYGDTHEGQPNEKEYRAYLSKVKSNILKNSLFPIKLKPIREIDPLFK